MVNATHARQLGIVQVLRTRTHVPVRDLAERFGVSDRTIYRDIDNLTPTASRSKPPPVATAATGSPRKTRSPSTPTRPCACTSSASSTRRPQTARPRSAVVPLGSAAPCRR
ncbi:HTH domain-containing protein [Streptomyces lydicamycinicus]|uniref:HTH domain-containing protein n=1 Tax=Streptomyces lydicamycinicus TaxID=1546107 RepID=UPI001CA5391E